MYENEKLYNHSGKFLVQSYKTLLKHLLHIKINVILEDKKDLSKNTFNFIHNNTTHKKQKYLSNSK